METLVNDIDTFSDEQRRAWESIVAADMQSSDPMHLCSGLGIKILSVDENVTLNCFGPSGLIRITLPTTEVAACLLGLT